MWKCFDDITKKERKLCRMKITHMVEKTNMGTCEEVLLEKKVVEFDNRRKYVVSKVVELKIGLILLILGRLEELRLLIENIFHIL